METSIEAGQQAGIEKRSGQAVLTTTGQEQKSNGAFAQLRNLGKRIFGNPAPEGNFGNKKKSIHEPKEIYNSSHKYPEELARIRGEKKYAEGFYKVGEEGNKVIDEDAVGKVLDSINEKLDTPDEFFNVVNIDGGYKSEECFVVYSLDPYGIDRTSIKRIVFTDKPGRYLKHAGRLVTLDPGLFQVFSSQPGNNNPNICPIVGKDNQGNSLVAGAVVFGKRITETVHAPAETESGKELSSAAA